MVQGNIKGIRKSILEKIDDLYEININKENICSYELIENMNNITRSIGKEISVCIDRKGKIVSIIIGDKSSVEIPFLQASNKKLSGIRIIHTHPNGNSELSLLDISTLLDMRLDAIVSIGVKENISGVKFNIGLCDVKNKSIVLREIKNLSINEVVEFNFKDNIQYIEKVLKETKMNESENERAILVSTDSKESLEELRRLSVACNILPIYKVFQNKNKIDATYYMGEGKVKELIYLRQIKDANVVIFDDELSSSQIRNLEDQIGCRVIDRTELILEIFSKRAKSKQAKLQVELAKLKHSLSRLRGSGKDLDKIKGGVGLKGGLGSRGSGEKKLETDRRYIETRVQDIQGELAKIVNSRVVQKDRRNKNNVSRVALVGYTNAGKSTLRNKICEISSSNNVLKKGVFEADMLFATLDTTIRSVILSNNRKIVLSDTVGFINKLPHELVEAFKSTLEEVVEGDVLLHVVDASSKGAINQIKAVNSVLEDMQVVNKKIIVVLNKIDKASRDNLDNLRSFLKGKSVVEVSAFTGENVNSLLDVIGENIPIKLFQKEFVIPYKNQEMVSMIYENCNVINKDYREDGAYIKAQVYEEIYEKCKKFEV